MWLMAPRTVTVNMWWPALTRNRWAGHARRCRYDRRHDDLEQGWERHYYQVEGASKIPKLNHLLGDRKTRATKTMTNHMDSPGPT